MELKFYHIYVNSEKLLCILYMTNWALFPSTSCLFLVSFKLAPLLTIFSADTFLTRTGRKQLTQLKYTYTHTHTHSESLISSWVWNSKVCAAESNQKSISTARSERVKICLQLEVWENWLRNGLNCGKCFSNLAEIVPGPVPDANCSNWTLAVNMCGMCLVADASTTATS